MELLNFQSPLFEPFFRHNMYIKLKLFALPIRIFGKNGPLFYEKSEKKPVEAAYLLHIYLERLRGPIVHT